MSTTRRAAMALALVLALVPACRPRTPEPPGTGTGTTNGQPPDAVTENTGGGADEAGGPALPAAPAAPSDGSAVIAPAHPAAAAPAAEPAARPDALRRAMPASTTAAALIDLRAARATLAGWLAGSRDADPARMDLVIATRLADALGDPTLLTRLQPAQAAGLGLALLDGDALLVVADAGLVRDAPADGGAPVAIGSGANVAVVRDGVVRVGARDAVARAMDEAAFDPASLGPVWTALPSDALATILVPDTARAPQRVQDGLALLGRAESDGVGLALDTRGGLTLTLRSSDREAPSRALGAAQVLVSQSLGALQQRAAPELQGGVGYLSLVSRSVWSRLRLQTEGDTTIVRLVEPDCGGPLANVPAALAIGAALAASARDPQGLALPFSPMGAPTTRCDARPPTLPDLPEGHVRIATGGRRNLVVLADVAGGLRQLLPTAGGLLPLRLDDRAVQDAVGDAFLGLRGVHDAEGSGALAVDLDRADAAMLVLPAGSAALGGANAQLSGLRLTQGGHVGALFGAPGENTLARSRAEPTTARLAAAAALPEGVWLALVADAGALLGAEPDGGDANAVAASVRRSEAVAFGLGVDGVVLVLPQATADAAALRDALPAFVSELVRRLARRGGSDRAGPDAAQVEAALDGVRIEVRDLAATVSWGGDAGWSRGRLAALVLGPAIGGALPVSGLDLDDVRERLLQNVASNPHLRTPRAPTPPAQPE